MENIVNIIIEINNVDLEVEIATIETKRISLIVKVDRLVVTFINPSTTALKTVITLVHRKKRITSKCQQKNLKVVKQVRHLIVLSSTLVVEQMFLGTINSLKSRADIVFSDSELKKS